MTPDKQDLGGNLTLGDREDLLAELSALDERRSRIAEASGRLVLDEARALARENAGIEAETRLGHGGSLDTLLELEADARRFVIGKRAEHADFSKGHLGNNL